MNEDKDLNGVSRNSPDSRFEYPHQSVSLYTTLRVLNAMKKEMGLEVMLEYLDKYLEMIEQHNPKLKMAVTKALSMLNVAKIYKDACLWENKEGI